ncbi:MAG: hypothetical protein P8X91_09590, partial [Candidatus Bathyarchaeota archaeon]
SAVYVLYGKGQPREILGWLRNIEDMILIENDRTILDLQFSSGSGSAIRLPDNSILEIRAVCFKGEE